MFYLVATVLFNTVLFILFKIFPKYKINTLQAIVVNYLTCVITGSILLGTFPVNNVSFQQPWLPWSLLMGAMFICVFNLIGYSTLKDGITTTTVANKLSMVIPVIFSFFLYNEAMGIWKIMGILIAFPAVYLTTRVEEAGKKGQELLWPVLLFISSGLVDTLVKYTENRFIDTNATLIAFIIHVFLTASTIGMIIIVIQAMRKKTQLHFRNIVAGVILGVPNFFSMYYFIRLLESGFLQSSAAIPVNNIGIVLVSALSAILFFREKISTLRIIGLVLSIAAILLIALGDLHGRSI